MSVHGVPAGSSGRLLAQGLAVVVGGMAGTAARLVVDGVILRGDLVVGTLVVNVLGALLLGLVLARRPQADTRGLFVGPGFVGALTTFSALQVEAVRLLEQGRGGTAAGYLALSVVLGLVAAGVGRRLGRRERT